MGKEYILYITRYRGAKGEQPEDFYLYRYNAEQLAAFGGPGGILWKDYSWIIDGDDAWRMNRDHLWDSEDVPNLTAAKAIGERLSLTDLKAAINAGLGN